MGLAFASRRHVKQGGIIALQQVVIVAQAPFAQSPSEQMWDPNPKV
jgi:hypothetical protein